MAANWGSLVLSRHKRRIMNITPELTDAAIAQVASEEYIALFLNPEAWTLYRRTGVPVIPPQGSGGVPRRLIYPQSEYSYNAANAPKATLYTPTIFWDK